MNTATFLGNVANLKHFGWQVEIMGNLVKFRHSVRAPGSCDPVTAVCLEVNGLTCEQFDRTYIEPDFRWTVATRMLGLDSSCLDPLLNPANYPADPLALGLLEAMFGDAEGTMARIRKWYPQPVAA